MKQLDARWFTSCYGYGCDRPDDDGGKPDHGDHGDISVWSVNDCDCGVFRLR